MSTSAPVTKPETPPATTAGPKLRLRKRVLLAGMAGGLLVCLFTPAVFRLGVHAALLVVAHQKHVDLSITKLKGSIFEPVSLYGVKLSAFSNARTTTNLDIARVDVDFSIPNLVFRRAAGCVRSVSIDGLNGTVKLQPQGAAQDASPAPQGNEGEARLWPLKLIPARIDAMHINLIVQQGNDTVRFENLRCTASDVEPGEIAVEKIEIEQPWLKKTFTAVKGITALRNSRFSIGNLALEKGVTLTSASSDVTEIANGRIKVDFALAAFDGTITGDLKSANGDLHSLLEANGRFAQISVAPLADFFDYTGESGGVIKEGNFTFRGSLRDLEKATLSVRLEAVDFQLGKRQWNSLVGGALLVENRLQINELHLKQAHNELSLKGQTSLPSPGSEWWQSDFAFDIAAKVDNLTELSSLFGPGFADLAGKVSVEGSIKGANQAFSGDLAVSGSGLAYRTAPLDTLHASVHLNGNELQVTKLELASKNDFVRGSGVVNILGKEKRYWGELKASVAELSRYSAIMQKPVVPQPLAGGLTVEWSGDGVSKAHSGAFHAQLKKFRQVSITEPKAHPLNADMEATYSPGNIFFSKFVIWDTDTNFSAKVTASPKTLNLQSLRLQQNNALWLEGDALLPFNVWSAWENASWATLLEFDSPCKINLTAKNLDLHETALLSGRTLPVKGELDMKLTADGTLNALITDGRLQLKKAQITLGETEPDVIGADADLTAAGQDLQIDKAQARFNAREFGMTGKVHFANLRDPDFEVAVRMKKIPFTLREDVKIDTDLDLNVKGTYAQALVSGSGQLLDIKLEKKINALALLADKYDLKLSPALPYDASKAPLNKWQYDVAFNGTQPAKIIWAKDETVYEEGTISGIAGSLTTNLTARGTGAEIRLAGRVNFQNVPVISPDLKPSSPATTILLQWTINDGTLLYPADDSPVWIAVSLSGKIARDNYTGWIYGRENAKTLFFFSNSALTQYEILTPVLKGAIAAPAAFGDIGPLELNHYTPPAKSLFDLRTQ